MKLEAFLLSDAATSENGKLYVLGAFDAVTAKELPVTISNLAISVRARFSKSEIGKHKIEFQIISPEKKVTINPTGEFEIIQKADYDT